MNPLIHRLRLTGFAVGYLALGTCAMALFIWNLTALALLLLTVGGLMLLPSVPLTERVADGLRALSSRVSGRPIPAAYKPFPGGGPLELLRHWAGDPARWRDLLGTYLAWQVGLVLELLVISFFLGTLWYLVFPLVFWIWPDVFAQEYGIATLDTQAESFIMWVFASATFMLWWWLTPVLLRVRAAIDRAAFSPTRAQLERRVAEVSRSRAATIDHSAAELRRIERDLHDGAQARLVALGMNLGMAEELVESDPQAARRLLEEARTSTTTALGELRSVVRGIHPPVLADRGLVGAVQALALDLAIPSTVTATLTTRPPAPVESAVYFAVAECLANVSKHSRATRVGVGLAQRGDALVATVVDDGVGGASMDDGTGLRGVAHRLGAFDGTMIVDSPVGGPTTITMELPCALSSERTSPSSGTA